MCYYCSRFPVRFPFPVVRDLILVPFLVLVVDTVIIPLVVPLSGERRLSQRGRVFRRPKCATARRWCLSLVDELFCQRLYRSLTRGGCARRGRVFRRPRCFTVRPSRPSLVKNSLNCYYSLLRGEYRRKSSSVIWCESRWDIVPSLVNWVRYRESRLTVYYLCFVVTVDKNCLPWFSFIYRCKYLFVFCNMFILWKKLSCLLHRPSIGQLTLHKFAPYATYRPISFHL